MKAIEKKVKEERATLVVAPYKGDITLEMWLKTAKSNPYPNPRFYQHYQQHLH